MKALVRIIVPSESKDASVSRRDFLRAVKNTERFLCEKFGGCTLIVQGAGRWIDEDNKIVKEEVSIVEAYALELGEFDRREVTDFCCELSKKLSQDCVLFTITPVEIVRFCS